MVPIFLAHLLVNFFGNTIMIIIKYRGGSRGVQRVIFNLIALQDHTLNSNAEWGCVIDRVILRVYTNDLHW